MVNNSIALVLRRTTDKEFPEMRAGSFRSRARVLLPRELQQRRPRLSRTRSAQCRRSSFVCLTCDHSLRVARIASRVPAITSPSITMSFGPGYSWCNLRRPPFQLCLHALQPCVVVRPDFLGIELHQSLDFPRRFP